MTKRSLPVEALSVGSRPGFGQRHQALSALLEVAEPAGVERLSWLNGELPLEVAAYLGMADIPDELVTSIRCIVRVDDRIVVCDTRDGTHPWPGGRREPGESHWETARREVHEETGWLIEPEPFDALGWIHLCHLRSQPEDHPYPHPDFIQLVCCAVAVEREGGVDAAWSDVEGWETASRLVPIPEARRQVSPTMLAHVFLDRL